MKGLVFGHVYYQGSGGQKKIALKACKTCGELIWRKYQVFCKECMAGRQVTRERIKMAREKAKTLGMTEAEIVTEAQRFAIDYLHHLDGGNDNEAFAR